jgi:hypothetical protein
MDSETSRDRCRYFGGLFSQDSNAKTLWLATYSTNRAICVFVLP